MNQEELEMIKLSISIASIVVTSVFSLVTIIITCYNANRQVKESEKALKQQAEQYEKEKLHNKEIVRIQKRPYLVFDTKNSRCWCSGNDNHEMKIYLENKGNGSAFKIEPSIETTASNGTIIRRKEPLQNAIAMINESCETTWIFNSSKRNFDFSIIVKFEDMSAQLYEQTFKFTLDDGFHMVVKNYAEPKLIQKEFEC